MRYHAWIKAVCIILGLAGPLSGCAGPRAGVIIAHRGASWHLPEHTLEAYALAHGMKAGMIEPDVVATRDGVLICAHDLTMEQTSDVAAVFPDRARGDGKWYWIDFDLAELRTLRRFGRSGDRAGDRGFTVATLDEMLTLVARLDATAGRTTGVIPEIKGPEFHAAHGVDLGAMVVAALAERGYTGPDDAAVVQCFDLETLERLHGSGVALRLVWLVGETPAEADLVRAAGFCHGLGPSRTLLEDEAGRGTALLARAGELGLALYPYTFRDEPGAVRRFLDVHGVDGVFCDDPAVLTRGD